MRTSGLAVSAADAIHAVGILPHRNIELADFLTGTAFCAFFGINFESVKGNFIENAVNRTERANVTAKRAVYYNRRKNRDQKDSKLPAEDETGGSTHGRIQKHKGNSAFKHSDRANPLAEPRLAKACDVNHEHRKKNHKNAEEKESEPAQAFFTGHATDFFYEWNLKKHVLRHQAHQGMNSSSFLERR